MAHEERSPAGCGHRFRVKLAAFRAWLAHIWTIIWGALPEQRQATPSRPPGIWVEKKQYRLPRPGSSARQPVRRLNEAEYALAELLRQLRDSALPAHVAEDTWRTATASARRLRSVATRLEAVELAAAHAPAPEQAWFGEGADELREHLGRGLDTYRGLIAAAGRVLLASTPDPAVDELVEATENLAGLAEALYELAPAAGKAEPR